MTQTLGYVALVVRDYDEAIAFFTQSLGVHADRGFSVDRPKWTRKAMGTRGAAGFPGDKASTGQGFYT